MIFANTTTDKVSMWRVTRKLDGVVFSNFHSTCSKCFFNFLLNISLPCQLNTKHKYVELLNACIKILSIVKVLATS